MACDIGIDRIEHIPPIGDVGHVLESIVAITPRRSQKFIGADAIGLLQIQRVAGLRILVDHAYIEGTPGIRLGTWLEILVGKYLYFRPAGWITPATFGASINHFQNLRPGHFADCCGIAKRQNCEHMTVVQKYRIM